MDCGYEFVNAKIRGMRSGMAERERLDTLCRCRNLFDLAGRLFPQREFASHVELQRAIVTEHAAELVHLVRYLGDRNAATYRGVMMRYVLENVKVVARALTTPGEPASAQENLVALPESLQPDVAALASTADIDALPELFDAERFRQAAGAALDHFKRTHNLFFFEAILDRTYFENLVEAARLHRGSVRRGLARLLDTEIAIYNVLLLLRGRTLHNMDYRVLREFLAPVVDPDAAADYQQLIHVEDLREFASRIPNRQVRKLSHKVFYTDYEFEQQLWQKLFELANAVFYKAILDLPGLIAFTYIKRMELLNLLRLVEGLRYGMGPEELKATMVRV